MTTPETPPASKAPTSARAQSSHKRTTMAVVTLLLATGFILAGAPAATAALASTNNDVPSTLGTLALPCGGDTPGFCP
jgi:hypothetical protein